jgi:hypothetical protein
MSLIPVSPTFNEVQSKSNKYALANSIHKKIITFGVAMYLEDGIIMMYDMEKQFRDSRNLFAYCMQFKHAYDRFSRRKVTQSISFLIAVEVCDMYARYHQISDHRLYKTNKRLKFLMEYFNYPEIEIKDL